MDGRDGSEPPLPRYGDPSARRYSRPPWVVVLGLVAVAFGLLTLVWEAIRGFATRDLGSEIAAIFAGLLIAGSIVAWSIYCWPLVRAFRATHATNPQSLILGARIPNLGIGTIDRLWPSHWDGPVAPQRLILCIDGSGIRAFGIGLPLRLRFAVSWDQVRDVAVVEYVESGTAFQGFAITDATAASAVLVQILSSSAIVRFPLGKDLSKLADRVNAQRPSVQST